MTIDVCYMRNIILISMCIFAEKSWQCSSRYLNVFYLFASLASKDGKTDIGDTLVKAQFPFGRIPAYFANFPL